MGKKEKTFLETELGGMVAFERREGETTKGLRKGLRILSLS